MKNGMNEWQRQENAPLARGSQERSNAAFQLEIERLRAALRDLIEAYISDVNPNDRNETAIEHARRNMC